MQTSHPVPDRGALAALLLLVLVWAYSWIIMKQVLQYSGPFDFAALRHLGGTMVLFLVLVTRGQSLRPTHIRATILIGLCQTTAFQLLTQWALVAGDASQTSLLAYTMPFWTLLFAWALLDHRPTARQWLGLLFALTGLVLIMRPWQGARVQLFSAALAIGGGAAWGLATVLTKELFTRQAPALLNFTAWQMAYGTAVLILVACLVPSRQIEWNSAFIFCLAYAAILATSLAWVLWALIVNRLSAATASLSSLLVPSGVVLMAWAILHERPSGAKLLGIGLILLGLLVVRRRR